MNNGSVRRMIKLMESRSPTLDTIARSNPVRRAGRCCGSGSLADKIEMKITLSTPRTISRMVSVTSAIQISGLNSHSMMGT